MPRKSEFSVDEETLKSLQERGITSPILEARLAYIEASQLLSHYLVPMANLERVYPNMCGPQASGRLSVSDPPLINFTADTKYGPHGIRDVVRPDPGKEWVCFDLEAVEARFIAVCCQDPVDSEIFARGWDIHTVTAINMLKWPWPSFQPTKENLFGKIGTSWRKEIGALIGEAEYTNSSRFRTLAKNCRYTLQYALNEKAMSRYAVAMKMEKEKLWAFGKMYLASKPWLVSWKKRTWEDCWRKHEARTAFGRRRRLVGDRLKVMKEGLNHIIQGTVADLMKKIIFSVVSAMTTKVAYQTHDGVKFIFTAGRAPMAELKALVERTWELWGKPVFIPATWEVIHG